ncbi:cupin domain-containing protein [Microbacterium sp. 18062]|uniref:cupin domain-containing protein n=1 Tax=Microbacterium sp. 18062 TaxID=2681410 RepID=UPI00135A1A6A|nr:cupin domain-containing protein [Microbacterium sp. 18062]
MQRPENRPSTAERLDLGPHPEGGWFRRTWAGGHPVDTAAGTRPAATCIHYLLVPGESSAWHVVTSDEIWLWHGPGVLELSFGGSGDRPGEVRTVLLGPDLAAGQRPQWVVPAGVWQAARLAGDDEVLVSCVVSPGFSFDDWRLAE